MRLGGPTFVINKDPERWIAYLKQTGYRAAYCPVGNDAPDDVVRDYAKLAEKENIVIAEVGAWSNPISPDKEERASALLYCKKQLELAERIGACCCVNIAGSRGDSWHAPHPDNLTGETFEIIVETVRDIIDSVKPTRTFFTLETMPWIYPDTVDSYLKLINAIGRERFAVHMDIVNMINSPAVYFNNASLIREFCTKLGPYIKSCHAKDILLINKLTVHLDEVRLGLGALDYDVLLKELDKLDPDTPLMLEHLPSEDEYQKAAAFVREKAGSVGVSL